jgi:leucine dehydrogenase
MPDHAHSGGPLLRIGYRLAFLVSARWGIRWTGLTDPRLHSFGVFEELLKGWDGEEVVVHHDRGSGAWMFVCVHSTRLGPAMGGTRMRSYDSPHEALADGLRLSEAMTLKQAAAELPFGGGKAVLAVERIPHGAERRSLLERYADLVGSLGGTYVTAADMNTGRADMDVIAERCPFVLGRSRERGGSGDPAAGTAVGVFHGIVATAKRAFGGTVDGATLLVQGVGAVGAHLSELLARAGAHIVVSDVDAERSRSVAGPLGATIVAPDEAFATACDIFVPCATGGILRTPSIDALRCRAVAGAANNQLATPEDAVRLKARGILYAPDFVINAGGVIHLAGYEALGLSDAQVASRLEGIGRRLETVFDVASSEGITTDEAARSLARDRLGVEPG